MRFGDLAKIDDIGQPAIFIQQDGTEIELEMFGIRFWLPDWLVTPFGTEEEDDAAEAA